MASCLYVGRVSHSRFRPRLHRFTYGICMVMVELPRAAPESAPVPAGRLTLPLPALLRWLLPIRRGDHLRSIAEADGKPLAEALETLVMQRNGIPLDQEGSVELLTGFGFLWHRFNPVSFYFCRDRFGDPQCLVAEVTNTPWNEQAVYVLDARDQRGSELRFTCGKELHVSPFMPMDTSYHWHIRQRSDQLLINIAVEHKGRPLFNAAMDLDRQPLVASSVLAALTRQPLMSLSVAWRIHWQALRLWLKATPLFSHPRLRTGDK